MSTIDLRDRIHTLALALDRLAERAHPAVLKELDLAVEDMHRRISMLSRISHRLKSQEEGQ